MPSASVVGWWKRGRPEGWIGPPAEASACTRMSLLLVSITDGDFHVRQIAITTSKQRSPTAKHAQNSSCISSTKAHLLRRVKSETLVIGGRTDFDGEANDLASAVALYCDAS